MGVLDTKRFGGSFAINAEGVASSSRGLVGDTVFAVLPNVKPMHTFIITIVFQSVGAIQSQISSECLIFFRVDLHGKTLENTDVQILPVCSYTL